MCHRTHYYTIDGTLALLALNEIILVWIIYELLNPGPICWQEILKNVNETSVVFDKQVIEQFGLASQKLLRIRMYRTLDTCMKIRFDALMSDKLVMKDSNTLNFPFRNQLITGLFESALALLANSWYIWLLWRARFPNTVTPNNVALPVLTMAALSSLFWIIVSILYSWPNLWHESLFQQPPTPPFCEVRILLLIASAIIINWLLLYSLYHAFMENKNGVAKIKILKSDKLL